MADLENPLRLKFSEALAYLKSKYGLTLTRQTLSNWRTHGINNEKLEAVRLGYSWYTTEAALDRMMTMRV